MWAGITIFRRNFFVSVPKNYVGEPFNLSLISGIENYMLEGDLSRFSVDFFFVSRYRKLRRSNLC